MKLSEVKLDAGKVEQGAWVENIPDMGDLRLKVRGLNNVRYRKLFAKLTDAVPRSQKIGGRVDPDVQDRIVSTCLLETVLDDWDNLENDDGSPQPYSKELARIYLFEPEYRKFRDATIWSANTVGEADMVKQEEALGNSAPASAGN